MFELKRIMETDVTYVNKETHIYVAMNLLVKEGLNSMPVVNKDLNLIGIINENHVLDILTSEELTDEKQVADYMRKTAKSFQVVDSAVDVCDYFIENPEVTMVPVVESQKLVGVVRRRDIIYLILSIRGKIYSKNRG